MPTHAFTVQKLADAAGVGVEAIRYYQRRGLLAEPVRSGGGFREYTDEDVRRLRFIKRAQDLGFSLDDIAELTSLSAWKDRARVREVARLRVAQMRERAAQLESMATALEDLADCCARTSISQACPIIASLVDAPLLRAAPRTGVARTRSAREQGKALAASGVRA